MLQFCSHLATANCDSAMTCALGTRPVDAETTGGHQDDFLTAYKKNATTPPPSHKKKDTYIYIYIYVYLSLSLSLSLPTPPLRRKIRIKHPGDGTPTCLAANKAETPKPEIHIRRLSTAAGPHHGHSA